MKRKMLAVFAVIMALQGGAGAFALNSSEKDYLVYGDYYHERDYYYDRYDDRYYDRYDDWYYDRRYDRDDDRYYDRRRYDRYDDRYYYGRYYRGYGDDIFDEKNYRTYYKDSKTYYVFEDFYYKNDTKRYVEIRYYYKDSDKIYDIREYYYDKGKKKYNVNVKEEKLNKKDLEYYLEYYLEYRGDYDRYYDRKHDRYYYYDKNRDRYYYYDRRGDKYYYKDGEYDSLGNFVDKVGDIAYFNGRRRNDSYTRYPWRYGNENYYYSEYNDRVMRSRYANIAKMLPSYFPDKNGNYPKKEEYKDKKKELTEALSDQIIFEKSYINTVYFEPNTVKSLLGKFFYEQTKNLMTDKERLNAFLYYFGFTNGFENEFGYAKAAKEFLIDFGERYYLLLKYYDEGSLSSAEIKNMKGYDYSISGSSEGTSTGTTVIDYFAEKNKKISEELK